MKKLLRMWAHFWIIGTLITFGVALWLWQRDEPIEAAAVVMLSPFPWPGPEV